MVWSDVKVSARSCDRAIELESWAKKLFVDVKEQVVGFMLDGALHSGLGRLIQAWAGQKSFRCRNDAGSGRGGDLHGESVPYSDHPYAYRPASVGPQQVWQARNRSSAIWHRPSWRKWNGSDSRP